MLHQSKKCIDVNFKRIGIPIQQSSCYYASMYNGKTQTKIQSYHLNLSGFHSLFPFN